MEDIDVKIIKKRKELGLTQVQAAKHLQVSIGTYNQWESGMTIPSKKHIARVLDFLGIVKEKKLTAVEWVVEQLTPAISLRQKYIDEIKSQAKQMEKEQHSETWIDAQANLRELTFIGKEKRFEDYYNETYNTETHGI